MDKIKHTLSDDNTSIPVVSDKIFTERYNICLKCDRFGTLDNSEHEICSECMCGVKGKALSPSSSCPLDKWNAVLD
jgi:hypothetical protein